MLFALIGTSATCSLIGGAGVSAVFIDEYNGANSGGVRVLDHNVSIDSSHGVADHSEEEVSLSRFLVYVFRSDIITHHTCTNATLTNHFTMSSVFKSESRKQ